MDKFRRGAVWFDRLMHRLENTVLTAQGSTESASAAIRQIAAGNEDLSSRTGEHAVSLEEAEWFDSTPAQSGVLAQNDERRFRRTSGRKLRKGLRHRSNAGSFEMRHERSRVIGKWEPRST